MMITCRCEHCGGAYRVHNSDRDKPKSRWCSDFCSRTAKRKNGGRTPKKPGKRQTFGHSASARMPDYVNGRPVAGFDAALINRESRRVFDEYDNICNMEDR
jgi:transposase-like protein